MSELPHLADLPLMRPHLPCADQILPYLRRIDEAQRYTNFGPLEQEYCQALVLEHQRRHGTSVHGVLASSATQALEMALSELDLPPGSSVAIPAITFIATATAVQRCGHIPVVLDVDADSWLLTPEQMPNDPAQAGIAAVIPVASFGMPQDAEVWSQWSKRHGIPVVIDAASAFGAQKTAPGVMAIFSLHATKSLSCGEGGLILTEDANSAHRLKALSNFGIGLASHGRGSNTKLSEYHAAVGLAHLAVWSEQVQRRQQLHQRYTQLLHEVLGQEVKFQRDTGLFAPSIMSVQFATEAARTQIEAICASNGIETRRWYQPLIKNQTSIIRVNQPCATSNADYLSTTLLGLPFFLGMTQVDVRRVVVICRLAISKMAAKPSKRHLVL